MTICRQVKVDRLGRRYGEISTSIFTQIDYNKFEARPWLNLIYLTS
jgi:hypothetical protein